ncbi:MAG: riboflavin synthase [Halanaerobiales bacterium]|nr:riboflavin synthase [Halanaerobiales bacterium]
MFTGIVQEVGTLKRKVKTSDKYKLVIKAEDFLDDVSIGDSIAVNGVCLTVVKINSNSFTVDVMPETVKSTNIEEVHNGTPLNLEKSLQPYNFMGGHIVSGHVDGTGMVKSIKKQKNSRLIDLKVSEEVSKYIVDKGSIALNGISLTIAEIKDDSITVSIIPETWNSTNFKYLKTGDKLNIEVDIVGKYVNKLMNKKQEEKEKKKKITKDLLRENGFI